MGIKSRTASPVIPRKVFMQQIPDQVRVLLPPFLQSLRWKARSHLVQMYYDDPAVHYEVWPIRKLDVVEVGLHMESRNRELNDFLLRALDPLMFEVRAQLGPDVELERWSKGWAKLYRLRPWPRFDRDAMRGMATDVAAMIRVVEPMVREALYKRSLPLPD